MAIKPRLLLLVTLIFSVISTQSTFAQNAQSEVDKAFIAAVSSYNLKEMQKNIEAGADVNALFSYDWSDGDCYWRVESSPLIFAIRNDRFEMVKILLKVKKTLHAALNQAIFEAVKEGCSDIVAELIKEGADANWVDNGYEKPLLHIAISGGKKKIIQILLKAGAKVDHVTLMEAIERYDFDTVQDLLKIPAITKGSFFGFGKKPINNADKDGNTALIIAIKNVKTRYSDNYGYNRCLNSQKIVEALLKTPGIDLYHVNKKGETAITLLEELNSQR